MLKGADLAIARQVQLAAAPGFLGRAVACIGSANRTALWAAGVVEHMTTHCAESAALVLREEGMVRALTRLLDPAEQVPE
jgi:hypothetical protein